MTDTSPRPNRAMSANDAVALFSENEHLRHTVADLRRELDAALRQSERLVRDAKAARDEEVTELRSQVVAMRAEIERLRAVYQDRLNAAENGFQETRAQLTGTIAELRARLESPDG
ncbi:MAG: hypothetical protein ACPGO3_11195 [Magnetospiraceae bacterium]